MKKLFASLALLIIYYLLTSFIAWEFVWIHLPWVWRVLFILGLFIPVWITTLIYTETPEFLQEKTHSEKKYSIRKYIWELSEELKLYAEARDLESRINQLRKK